MQVIKKATLALAMLGIIGGSSLAYVSPAFAACSAGQVDAGNGNCAACSGANCVTSGVDQIKTGGSKSSDLNTFFKTLTNMILFILGAIAVIMIVIGGVKYTTSNGNADQVKSAKNTVMYSVIGLVVAIMAYAIVNWVVTKL